MDDLTFINTSVIDLIRKITKEQAIEYFNIKPEVYDAINAVPDDKVYVLQNVKQLLIKVSPK